MVGYLRRMTSALATWTCIGLLAGCSTARMNSQWTDPGFTGRPPDSDRVLVLCLARDDTLRRLCEDRWAIELGVQGLSAVRSYSLPGFPPYGRAGPDEIKAAALASGAWSVARMQLALSDLIVFNSGPQMGVGVGGGDAYRGGGFSFGGFGLSFPVGGATATQGMSSSATLVDPASGKLLWSGNASTTADGDETAQVSALTRITVEALKKAGLF